MSVFVFFTNGQREPRSHCCDLIRMVGLAVGLERPGLGPKVKMDFCKHFLTGGWGSPADTVAITDALGVCTAPGSKCLQNGSCNMHADVSATV